MGRLRRWLWGKVWSPEGRVSAPRGDAGTGLVHFTPQYAFTEKTRPREELKHWERKTVNSVATWRMTRREEEFLLRSRTVSESEVSERAWDGRTAQEQGQ